MSIVPLTQLLDITNFYYKPRWRYYTMTQRINISGLCHAKIIGCVLENILLKTAKWSEKSIYLSEFYYIFSDFK